jgi:hypothetical protein
MTTKNNTKNPPSQQQSYILIRLEGDLKTQFEALHNLYNFTSKTNTIRKIIKEKYDEHKNTGKIP